MDKDDVSERVKVREIKVLSDNHYVLRKATYDCVSWCNGRHMTFAWCSLFSVALTDVYIRLCSMGVIHDWRIF